MTENPAPRDPAVGTPAPAPRDGRDPAADRPTPLVDPVAVPPGLRGRYARHLSLPGIGLTGQGRLRAARVLCVGAGGLGSPVALYLAAAGVGTLGIIDDDTVDESNLQRQVIHGTADVGRPKTASAAARIRDLNPDVTVVAHDRRLSDDGDIRDLLAGYDVIVDGSDNYDTRYLVADLAAELGLPVVWGSVARFDGQVSVFWNRPLPGCGPAVTLRDVFPSPPPDGTVPDCSTGGVVGVLPGVVGTMMAAETVKLITGHGRTLLGTLGVWDGERAVFRRFDVSAVAGTGGGGERDERDGGGERHGGGERDGAGERNGGEDVPGTGPAAPGTPRRVAAADLDPAWLGAFAAEGGVVVDVREPPEWAGGVLGDPVRLPLSTLRDGDDGDLGDLGDLGGLPHDTPLLVYCAGGVRSAEAARRLRDRGFSDVRDVDGGIVGWWEAGHPGDAGTGLG
ncbi:ThiF family adenylyltransferase [Corynebacterium bovis]|uniref:ThiF family adenylyltransferase n=1 Tax=Corynebacterium bovis TaxID=36808 RepID=UPI00254A938B|nr:ThiF family adenylyltransferase [Corynebacterium bovis]MDK8511143.1 ThiF family adenylyltransferase [Corynebacterium bovis]